MGQHAALRRDVVAGTHLVQHVQQGGGAGDAVRGRVDADHRIPRTQQQPVQRGRRDAARVVRGVVGLQADGEAARQANRVAKRRGDAAARGDGNEVLQAHDLADRRSHFRRDAGTQSGERGAVRLGQKIIPKAANRQMRDGRESEGVVRVEDEPGDVVRLVGNDRLGENVGQRQIRQSQLGGDTLRGALGRDASQHVAGTRRRGAGQEGAQVGEGVRGAANRVPVCHAVVLGVE